ncbi:hypothetical protein LMH73_026725 [Vibrio splendidus]|nr:hypothetical protein [Vibrio splendidus]MCC4880426.1 hypothetical protein [Vibrio splendidus]
MSKVFKRDIEDMLSEININIADNIKEIAEISPEVTRYFQLVGQNSNLVSDRQYALAKGMKDSGASNDEIIRATQLIWCDLDLDFKGIIFEPMEFRTMPIEMMLEQPDERKYKNIMLTQLVPHHSIYDAYPDIKNIAVSFSDLGKSAGSLCVGSKTINIDIKHMQHYLKHDGFNHAMSALISIVNHEMTHYVQSLEPNWSRGTSPSLMFKSNTPKLIQQSMTRYLKAYPDFGLKVSEHNALSAALQKKYDVDEESLFDVMSPIEEEELLAKLDEIEQMPESTVFFRMEDAMESIGANEPFNSLTWYQRVAGETLARFNESIHSRVSEDTERGIGREQSFLKHFSNAVSEAGIPLYRGNTDYDFKNIGVPRLFSRESMGFIDFYQNGQALVTMVQDKSNVSTVIHEFLGHYIYENIQKATALADCPAWLKKGAEQLESSVFDELISTHAKHERFSELAEAYLVNEYREQTPEIKALSAIINKELKMTLNAPPIASEMLSDSTYYYPFSEFYNELVSDSRAREDNSPSP